MTAVGIVGFGRMGGAIGVLLARRGDDVVVVDPDPDRQRAAADAGCRPVADLTHLVDAGVDPILLSLASTAAFDAVVDDLVDALVARPHGPRIVIDTSTLGLDTKERGRSRLIPAGATLLDCPLSGTGAQARHGDVVVYASGPEATVRSVADVLGAFAREVHIVGEFGDGTRFKMLANLLVGVHNAAAAEMIALAQRAGVDPELAVELAASGAGQSRMLEQRGRAMATGSYGYGATVDLFRKDLAIIGDFARALGATTPLLDVVARLYDEAAALGHGTDESAAVHAAYARDPG